jgi:hypothetical protein
MFSEIFSQTTITKVIDPGGTGDYTSLQQWATARGGDITAAGRNTIEVARCICTNGQADATVDLGSLFTTDANHYVKIYVDSLYRHKGIYPAYGSNIYRIECHSTPASGGSINATTAKIILDGIAIYDSVGATSGIILTDCSIGGYVSNCIIKRYHSIADEHGHGIKLFSHSVYSYYYVNNNLIYGWDDSIATDPVNCGILVLPEGASSKVYLDNNTIYNCEYGIWDRSGWSGDNPGIAIVRNNLIQNPNSDGFTDPLHVQASTFKYDTSGNVILSYYTPLGLIPIPNSGFEDTTSLGLFTKGNTLTETIIASGYWSHSGGHCLQVSSVSTGINIYTAAITGLTKNTTYTLSFWDKYNWGTTFTVSVRPSHTSSALNSVSTSKSDVNITNRTFSFNSGSNTSIIINISGSVSGTTCFDDFMIYPGLTPPTQSAYFVNPEAGDFHLLPTAALAIGKGVNLSLDSNDCFNNDIEGNKRVTPWDAGAFKFNIASFIDTPGVSTLLFPNNSSVISDTVSSILFAWESASNASTYEIQISQDINFNTLFIDTTGLTDTAFTYHFKNFTSTFFWRVRGNNIIGAGQWSAAMAVSLISGIDKPKNTLPVAYELFQNYPNPFNPSSKIRFALPKNSNTKIVVYNLLGEKVRELLNGQKNAGYYEVNFNTAGLASGVYLYTIEAKSLDGKNEYRESKKMILIK